MNLRNVSRIVIGLLLFLCSVIVPAGYGNNSSDGGGTQLGGAIQGKALTLTGTTSTLAGLVNFNPDGTGASAIFNNPYGITTDGEKLYIVDSYNNTIRTIQ